MNRTPKEIADELERTIPVMQEEAVRAMRAATGLTADRERQLAPGRLGAKVTAIVRENSTGVSGTVAPRSKIAGLVDHGTGLLHDSGFHHPVMSPTPGKVLKWVSRRDGLTYFRREVAGQRPQHFVERTRADVSVEAEQLLTAGAAAANERLFP